MPARARAALSLNHGDRPWKKDAKSPATGMLAYPGKRANSSERRESTVRYLGIEVDDAIEIAEKIDI